MGMENPRYCRNKTHFQVEDRAGGFRLGFYGEGSHRLSVVLGGEQSRGCLLADSALNKTATKIEALLTDTGGRRRTGAFSAMWC